MECAEMNLGLDEFPEEVAQVVHAKDHDEFAADTKQKLESKFDKNLLDKDAVEKKRKEFEENNILDDDEPDR